MLRFFLTTSAVLGLAVVAMAQGTPQTPPTPGPVSPPPVELQVGEPAPAFSLPGSDGKTHKLSDYKGKTVVLAWFPKAFTGG